MAKLVTFDEICNEYLPSEGCFNEFESKEHQVIALLILGMYAGCVDGHDEVNDALAQAHRIFKENYGREIQNLDRQ